MMRIAALGRPAFFAAAAALVVLLAGTLGRLPPIVASHFDGSGLPTGWSPRPWYAVLLLLIGVALPLGTIWLITMITRGGPEMLNIPARDYWRRPEHAAEAVARCRAWLWWLAAILAVTAGTLHLAILQAHQTLPPRLVLSSLFLVIGVLLGALALWTAGWYRLFRPDDRA